MSTIINSNIVGLNAQRNLSTSSASLASTIQRLSSGLRINSARDDAAGLAISERFSTQIRGLNVAARNANDGISLAQTAEGALAEVSNNLQRIRELSVQAANGTNSQTDRNALDAEVQQLKSEIQRVAEQTNFNNINLLDGSFAGVGFQIGANAGETITISSIENTQIAALGGTYTRVTGTIDAGDLTDFSTAIAAGGVTINGTDIGAITAAGSSQERAGQLVEAINRVSGQTGVGASYDLTTGQISLSSNSAITIAGSTNDAAVAGAANGSFGTSTTSNGLTSLSVQSVTDAQAAIGRIDGALNAVNTSRASLGAIQNRFTSVIQNLGTSSENLSAARSRIRDADYAKEVAELTRAQILQQAGQAMLSQANALPQSVLNLLR